MSVQIKGHYQASSLIAKIKYSSNKNKDPFAIELKSSLTENVKSEIWDLNAFRPDPRDNVDFYTKLRSTTGVEVMVLYEKVNSFAEYDTNSQNSQNSNVSSGIPRFIIWENKSNIYHFINVR